MANGTKKDASKAAPVAGNGYEIAAGVDNANKVHLMWVGIDTIHEDPKNPRSISDEDLLALMRSIKEFPEMMVLRPCVIGTNNVIVGGNQRHKACKRLGWPKIPAVWVEGLTEQQLREFAIKDNLPFGQWDKTALQFDWSVEELKGWGMKWADELLIRVEDEEKAEPIAERTRKGNLKHQKAIRLVYNEIDHDLILKNLLSIAETPEGAVDKLLSHWNKTHHTREGESK